MPASQLKRWIDSAEVILAADSGADQLHAVHVIPRATVGDMDSISETSARAQTRLIQVDDQDSTDCDKLLAFALEEGYEAITLAGVEGDLLDHVVGTLQSAAKSPLSVRLALRRGIGVLVQGPCRKQFVTRAQSRFSVIPLERCEGVSLSGTRWPLSLSTLEPFGLTSLSNISEGTTVELTIECGRAFVFLETDGSPSWGEP